MDNLNYRFFEEFKRLDNLCADLYDSRPGVTAYIDHMEATPSAVYRVDGWSEDLRQLKHLRHIRNHLAHDRGAFLEENCTQADIDWLSHFYSRIMERSDPIALSRRPPRRSVSPRTTSRTAQASVNLPRKQKKSVFVPILLILIFVIACLCAIIFLWNF